MLDIVLSVLYLLTHWIPQPCSEVNTLINLISQSKKLKQIHAKYLALAVPVAWTPVTRLCRFSVPVTELVVRLWAEGCIYTQGIKSEAKKIYLILYH